MGPDEFHERHPGAAEDGLRNNAYTNVMVAWICATVPAVLALLPARREKALRSRLGLGDDEIERWEDMSRKMLVPFHGDGIISQFEGYDDLAELDWDAYRERYGDRIGRLDRILGAEGDDPDRYKLAKQADVVMLFFLFSDGELAEIFERLGYEFGPDTARRNIEYYDARTSHGSTLSYITHASALAEFDPESSWERFLVALESDIGDIQGGTTKEGIHMGVMSGTLDLVQRGYLGTAMRGDVLCFAPHLTDRLEGLSFAMQFRGTPIHLSLSDRRLTVSVRAEGACDPIKIGVGDEVRALSPGDGFSFELAGAPARG
jgi:trehalose/maltose hydrolase-like predicted phosphorylase